MGRRLLIVDDDPAFRGLARALLDEAFDVIGEAATRSEALRALGTARPDVVLLDVHLPDGDGFSVAREIADAVPGIVVVLTSSDDFGSLGDEVTRSGAAGFVPKSELGEERMRREAGDR